MSMRRTNKSHFMGATFTSILVLAVLMIAGSAGAVEVFLNRVKITGALPGQIFEKAKVTIAVNGDVYIDAPGYKIEVESPTTPAPVQAARQLAKAPAGKYWLFLEAKITKQYKVGVSVNGKNVLNVPADSSQYIFDLGPHLQQGGNQVQVLFLPIPGSVRVVGAEAITVLVGEGRKGADGTLTITKVIRNLVQNSGKASAEAYPVAIVVP